MKISFKYDRDKWRDKRANVCQFRISGGEIKLRDALIERMQAVAVYKYSDVTQADLFMFALDRLDEQSRPDNPVLCFALSAADTDILEKLRERMQVTSKETVTYEIVLSRALKFADGQIF